MIDRFPSVPRMKQIHTQRYYLSTNFMLILSCLCIIISIASHFQVQCFEPGWKVFNEGDVADMFYVIIDGELSVSNKDDKGEAHFLANLQATLNDNETSKYFGETAFLKADIPRTATVTAVSRTILAGLSKQRYARFNPAWMKAVKENMEKVAGHRLSEILAKVPFLSFLPANKLRTLGDLFAYEIMYAGQVIFNEGDEGETFYICIDGEVSISVKGEGGENVVISTRGAGTNFGEIALLDAVRRTATVTAVIESRFLTLGAREFKKFLKVVPEVKTRYA